MSKVSDNARAHPDRVRSPVVAGQGRDFSQLGKEPLPPVGQNRIP